MNNITEQPLYRQDLQYIAALPLPWEKLHGRSLLLSGATGMIGSLLIDTLMLRHAQYGLHCNIYALGRNREMALQRFAYCADSPLFTFIPHDINTPLTDIEKDVDYVLHLASNTHPLAYSTDPIGTITTNVIGLYHLLEFAVEHKAKRLAFASSIEIYGENRGDTELFDEDYCGYINCNTMRAGYPESKRCAEALCQAYIRQKGLDVVIARLTRSYGPTMLMSDTKALSQFIRKGISKEDIVLKSAGTQYYSYTHAADAVSGLLTILLQGKTGEAYNVADEASDILLKDLAATIAAASGTKVIFELPDAIEAAGYSTATKARLNSAKLKALGWQPRYDIATGLTSTLEILKSLQA